jgi:endonuclease/exonuclease/phosphatase family metal-dependent hydrolase
LNVQTLFDGRYDGGEFDDFNPLASTWSDAAYRARLEALGEALRQFTPRGAPDILALQEIENLAVLTDLAAAVGKERYSYLLCAPEAPGAAGSTAMRVCVASRFPIRAASTHGLHAATEHPLRSSVETQIATPHGSLTLVVAHWKSRREGRAQTAALRRLAARSTSRVVERRLSESATARVIVAGDLNEEIEPSSRILGPSPQAALRVARAPAGARVGAQVSAQVSARAGASALYSPWHSIAGGSYVYRGRRQRIDHLLFSAGFFDGGAEGLVYRSAHLVDAWAGDDGAPARYERHLGRGVTDHFGLYATLVPASRHPGSTAP